MNRGTCLESPNMLKAVSELKRNQVGRENKARKDFSRRRGARATTVYSRSGTSVVHNDIEYPGDPTRHLWLVERRPAARPLHLALGIAELSGMDKLQRV